MDEPDQNLYEYLDYIRKSPREEGQVKLIACRPTVERRNVLNSCHIDIKNGLIGDNWYERGTKNSPDGAPHPDRQITLMNSRCIEILAGSKNRWSLAGDQFYVDFDLSKDNLPPGSKLQIGEGVIEITAEPHLGCHKFMSRFGKNALKFVNSEVGKSLNLRGINAKVISPGRVDLGATIKKNI